MTSYNDSEIVALIEKANSEIINTDIKGKGYAEVTQRVKALRKVFPTATIETIQTRHEGEVGSREVEYKAFIYIYVDGEKRLLADGDAYEKENSTFINKTSYIENCQTSAIGRAIGFTGIGIDTSIASYDEVRNAMENQKPKAEAKEFTPVTKDNWEQLNKAYTKEQIKQMYKDLGITRGADMPNEYAVKKIDEYLANIKNELPAKQFY